MPWTSSLIWLLLTIYGNVDLTNGERVLHSTRFSSCLSNSTLNATKFNASLNAENNTLSYSITASNSFSGVATVGLSLVANNEDLFDQVLDPCSMPAIPALCPSSEGPLNFASNQDLPDQVLEDLTPSIFTAPDPDARLQFTINDSMADRPVACVEAHLMNDVVSLSSSTTASSAPTDPTASSDPSSSPTESGVPGGDADSQGDDDESADSVGAGNMNIAGSLPSIQWSIPFILTWLLHWT